MRESGPVARVLICEDTRFRDVMLSSIVRDADCELIAPGGDSNLAAVLDALLPPPDLMIFPVCADGGELLEMVSNRDWLRMVPILAIGPQDPSGLDLWRLRGLGVVGLIDRRSTAEHVRFRLDEVIEARSCAPRHARVSCCFLVDVEAAGQLTSEFAVSFSLGGVGLASVRPLEPNTLVRVRLPVAAALERGVEVEGRVVRRVERADGRFDVGIAFLPLPAGICDIVAAEVRSLLLASGSQLGQAPRPGGTGNVEGRAGSGTHAATPRRPEPLARFGPRS